MRKIFFTLLIIISSTSTGFSNGGPVDGSALAKAGDIKLIDVKDVILIREKLKIEVVGDYSNVTVEYVLQNNGPKREINYGFPIDFLANHEYGMYVPEELQNNIPSFNIALNDNPLDYGSTLLEEEIKALNETYKRVWNTSSFMVEADQQVVLTIDYQVRNEFTDWETSKSFFTGYDQREFMYDFSPAASWGNGTVGTLDFELDLSTIIGADENAKCIWKSDSIRLKNGVYKQTLTNYSFTSADQLTLSYTNDVQKQSVRYLTDLKNVHPKIKSVKTSSQLKGNYSKDNMLDQNFNTAWAEGKPGNGVGEFIEIEFEPNTRAAVISLLNGYWKSKETYENNARIKIAQIEIWHTGWSDDQEVELMEWQHEFPDRPWQEIDRTNFGPLMDLVFDQGEGGYIVQKIKITVLETYPGKKYADLCLTEIMLLGWKPYDEE